MRRVLVVSLVVGASLAASALRPPTATAAAVTIDTVPQLAGIPIVVDGRVYKTNRLGRITVEADGALRDRVDVRDARVGPRTRATFSRWYGNLDKPSGKLTAALDLYFTFEWTFVDLHNRPIPFDRVTSIKFKTSHGRVRTFERKDFGRKHWVQGSRVISTPEGPRRKDLYFTVEKVIVDDTNVVNRAQQRFEPSKRRDMAFRLLFYKMEFSAFDALFKFPIGSGVKLTFPNGKVQEHNFTSAGKLTIDRLPRGEYWVVVNGPGMSFKRPVTLTKNQKVPLEVLSWIDIGFVFGVVFAIALGLLLIGRPWLLRYARLRTYRAQIAALRNRAAEGSA